MDVDDVVDVFTPQDEEPNPDGTAKDVAGQKKLRQKWESRWDEGDGQRRLKVETALQKVANSPQHWAAISVPATASTQQRHILQKILFTNAVCGTHSPQWKPAQV